MQRWHAKLATASAYNALIFSRSYKHAVTNTVTSSFLYACMHRVDRVLSFFSSRRNWNSPSPLANVPPRPFVRGEGHTRLRERGWGSPNSDDGTYTVVLCRYKYKYFVIAYVCKQLQVHFNRCFVFLVFRYFHVLLAWFGKKWCYMSDYIILCIPPAISYCWYFFSMLTLISNIC